MGFSRKWLGSFYILVSFAILQSSALDSTEDSLDSSVGKSPSATCHSLKLATIQNSAIYTWEIKEFLTYMDYLKTFNKEFEYETQNQTLMNSTKMDGAWKFKIVTKADHGLLITSEYKIISRALEVDFLVGLEIVQDENIIWSQQKTSGVARHEEFDANYYYNSLTGDREYRDASNSSTYTMEWTITNLTVQEMQSNAFESSDVTMRFKILGISPADQILADASCDGDKGTKIVRELSAPFSKAMPTLLFDETYADIQVQVENQNIPAHRVILANSSPTLQSMVQNATLLSDYTSPVLTIENNIGYNATMALLKYIYTGQVEQLDSLASKVIIAAQRYELAELKKVCESLLITQTTPQNVIQMYGLANEVGAIKLTRKAFAVMKENKAAVFGQSDDFKQLTLKYPNLMFELFISRK